MKTPEEMLEILGAIDFALPEDIEFEEMCCIMSWLISLYGLQSNWSKIQKRISDNISNEVSPDTFFLAKEEILSAQKDADDFLDRIRNDF